MENTGFSGNVKHINLKFRICKLKGDISREILTTSRPKNI